MLPRQEKIASLIVLLVLGLCPALASCGGARKACRFDLPDGSVEYNIYSDDRPAMRVDHGAPTLIAQDSAFFTFPPGSSVIRGDNLDESRKPNSGEVHVEGSTLVVTLKLGNGKPHPLNGRFPIIDTLTRKPIGGD